MDHPVRHQLTLLLTSPRVAPGLLSATAWDTVRGADAVLAADPDAATPRSLRAADVEVSRPGPEHLASPQSLARHLLTRVEGTLVWVGSPDGDPGLAEALAVELPEQDPPTLELLIASWDTPGARLLDAVSVMDRLRSPGGCPWDAEQTHTSLTPYLLEEAYEAAEVLERLDGPDGAGLRSDAVDELGDVLLQVLFHARVGADHPDDPFDVDDVAGALVAKLVRRHPHVFADRDEHDAQDAAAVEASWEAIKAQENAGKAHRAHPLDGIPAGMPSLARAAKVASRLERGGHEDWLASQVGELENAGDAGSRLLRAVLELRAQGTDPDAALRHTLRAVAQAARALGSDRT
ncbi:MazG family protein [Ornithinimicrobium pratense]|uniref:MazG family protein n=1 Tax=Ornithinimicrobium pratense TaxID=2593973 RepID=A0A5J6V3K7_9MICO|nr:MazG family protein [Ornithinimicrobium pratense]QFG67752.1 MazG family protein [Ornithinimicrobium pratense]